ESEGGKLARRLSGGGAVFHDIGNLNFTFLMGRTNYDFQRQAKVIHKAVEKAGIVSEVSGRNDLTVDGRKYSGNAFCFRKNSAYHHGTILVSVDMSKLSRYLQVSQEKLRSKGVQSVKSRVANLSEFKPSLTIEEMKSYMMETFQEEYGKSAEILTDDSFMDKAVLNKLYEKYSSWEWRYGESPSFDIELTERFDWGGVEIGLELENGIIKRAKVYSDAMDEEFINMLPELLEGCRFNSAAMAERIMGKPLEGQRKTYAQDISEWMLKKGF
ncbi:MAG TPA: lipoate--protein ligase, partial [Clostridiaceae bacterium]|nr:lipoate--protein ligase [Clostridiaceae bacterium]